MCKHLFQSWAVSEEQSRLTDHHSLLMNVRLGRAHQPHSLWESGRQMRPYLTAANQRLYSKAKVSSWPNSAVLGEHQFVYCCCVLFTVYLEVYCLLFSSVLRTMAEPCDSPCQATFLATSAHKYCLSRGMLLMTILTSMKA